MTIKESLRKWLQLYPNFDIEEFVDIDIAKDGGYALAKEPNIVTNTFLDGSVQRTEYYTFIAKKITTNETLRENTDEFLEDFEDWIYIKNLNGDYPMLKEKCYCDNISISSTYYLQSNEEKYGMYVFTIEITYRKEL